MPWHQGAMKDVVSCDKLRGGANNLWTEDFRMGQPTQGHACELPPEYNRAGRANPGDWNILVPGGKEINPEIPSVVASERGRA